MKKGLWVLLMALVMLVSTTGAVTAATIYLEAMNGNWETDHLKSDGNGFLLGGEFQFNNRFIAGIEYFSLSYNDFEYKFFPEKPDFGVDVTAFKLKGGYRIVATDRFTLDGILAYQSHKHDFGTGVDIEEFSYNGFLLGTDLSFEFTQKASLVISVGYSISDSCKASNEHDSIKLDASFTNYAVKFNYLFSENFGASLGYRAYSLDMDNFEVSAIEINGFAIGVFYKF